MMRFSNMEEFQLGYQFFMHKPSHAVKTFILVIFGILIAAFVWSLLARMDDVVKADVFLRPAQTVSIIKPLVGGQVHIKKYVHDGLIAEGDLLLQLDTSADILELRNSQELMNRILATMFVYTTLLSTIQKDTNSAAMNNDEAYAHSHRYILEKQRQQMHIAELRAKLEREQNAPEMLRVAEQINTLVYELESAELQFLLWKNTQTIDATDTIKNLTQNKENLERRISDLNRNIQNATIYAPISGRINEYRKLNIGDNITPGEEIITIVPDNIGLKAELYIDPAYIARVKIGQNVVLRFPGLPPSQYGKIEAAIDLIPADYIRSQNTAPVFIAEAAITEPWLVTRGGNRAYLRAGMGASGRIVIDHDTVLMMILKKLDFINESYNEKALSDKGK